MFTAAEVKEATPKFNKVPRLQQRKRQQLSCGVGIEQISGFAPQTGFKSSNRRETDARCQTGKRTFLTFVLAVSWRGGAWWSWVIYTLQ